MTVEAAAAVLAEIAYLLRHQEGQAHRSRAFTKAATSLLRQRPDLLLLRRQSRLTEIDGVGAGIARVLTELVDTERSSYLERLREEVELPPAPDNVSGTVAAQGYRGDLHSHTDWSDGHATVLEMAMAARSRGYEYLAITDHSPRITVVNGLGPERLAAQRTQIEDANRQVEGITILQGIEVDILEDGSLDLPDETLAALDVVVASPHIKLRQEAGAMTERMLRAVQNPHVDLIGHPTGRRPGSRPGAEYDFELVFKTAAQHGTALEIDCDPARMDLSPELAQAAAAAGCRLALDSDAHAPDQFVYVDLGLWMTRRAGLETTRLLNWHPLAELRAILA